MPASVMAAALDAVAPVLGLQILLLRCTTAADRKRLVLSAWEAGALDRDETSLLVTANMLEAA